MSIAIVTKFHGPTNSAGSRVSATAMMSDSNGKRERVTVPWDHALNSEQNHDAAARAFAERFGWHGSWHRGGAETGNVYFRVSVNSHAFTA